jgi:hypothetical protein
MNVESREEVDVFEETDEVQQEAVQPQTPQAKPAAPVAELVEETPEAKQEKIVRSAVAEAFKEHTPKPAAPAPKEMSEEEKRKFWAIFNPDEVDPKFMHQFFNLGDDADDMTLAQKKKLFASMQEGFARQFLTAAQHMMNARMAQVEERLAPLQEHYVQERSKTTRKNFDEAYPALADKKFDKVLRLSATALANNEFDSTEAYFKALAEHAADSIKAIVPEFDLGAPQTKPTPGTAPKTPRSRVGGTGGTGTGSTAAPVKTSRDDSDSIF